MDRCITHTGHYGTSLIYSGWRCHGDRMTLVQYRPLLYDLISLLLLFGMVDPV